MVGWEPSRGKDRSAGVSLAPGVNGVLEPNRAILIGVARLGSARRYSRATGPLMTLSGHPRFTIPAITL